MVGGTALAIQIKRNISKLFTNHRIIRQDHNLQIDILVNKVKVTFFSTGAVAIPFNVREYSFAEARLNIAGAKAIAA